MNNHKFNKDSASRRQSHNIDRVCFLTLRILTNSASELFEKMPQIKTKKRICTARGLRSLQPSVLLPAALISPNSMS